MFGLVDVTHAPLPQQLDNPVARVVGQLRWEVRLHFAGLAGGGYLAIPVYGCFVVRIQLHGVRPPHQVHERVSLEIEQCCGALFALGDMSLDVRSFPRIELAKPKSDQSAAFRMNFLAAAHGNELSFENQSLDPAPPRQTPHAAVYKGKCMAADFLTADSEKKSRIGNQSLGLAPQSVEHTGLRDIDAAKGNAQFRCHHISPPAIDDLTVKGLPSPRLKLPSDRVQQAFHHMLVVFLVPHPANTAGIVRQLVELLEKASLPGSYWPILPGAPEVTQSVYQNGAQPTPKGALATVVFELGQIAHHDGEHFLEKIVSVGILHVVSFEPPLQQRRIQLHQPIPRLGISPLASTI